MAFSVFSPSAKPYPPFCQALPCRKRQNPAQLLKHIGFHFQEEVAHRRNEEQEHEEADEHLQLNVDGKDIDLRDRLHQNAHADLSQQLRAEDGEGKLDRKQHALREKLDHALRRRPPQRRRPKGNDLA